mgnify:CR=1 FL=1
MKFAVSTACGSSAHTETGCAGRIKDHEQPASREVCRQQQTMHCASLVQPVVYPAVFCAHGRRKRGHQLLPAIYLLEVVLQLHQLRLVCCGKEQFQALRFSCFQLLDSGSCCSCLRVPAARTISLWWDSLHVLDAEFKPALVCSAHKHGAEAAATLPVACARTSMHLKVTRCGGACNAPLFAPPPGVPPRRGLGSPCCLLQRGLVHALH